MRTPVASTLFYKRRVQDVDDLMLLIAFEVLNLVLEHTPVLRHHSDLLGAPKKNAQARNAKKSYWVFLGEYSPRNTHSRYSNNFTNCTTFFIFGLFYIHGEH
jgi:hypothetical protein